MATELWIWHYYNLLLLALLAMGCAECRCHLFNTTTDQDGKPLPESYIGGLRCCGDGQHCAVAEGFNGEERTFHMKYTWEYFDWNDCLISTQNFAFDITKHEDLDEGKVCTWTRAILIVHSSPIGGKLLHSVAMV